MPAKHNRTYAQAVYVILALTVGIVVLIYLFPGPDYCEEKLKQRGASCIGACYVTAFAVSGHKTIKLSDKYVNALFNSCVSNEYKWDDAIMDKYGMGDCEHVDVWLNNGRMFPANVNYQRVSNVITIEVYGEIFDLLDREHWITSQLKDANQINSVETFFKVLQSIRMNGSDISLADGLATNK